MRKPLALVCVTVALAAAAPVHAQTRAEAQTLRQQQTSARLYDAGTGFTLNKLFSPQHFRMGHSVEFTSGSFGGQGYSLGMYTNTLAWQFDKVAARVDVSAARSFGGGAFGGNALGFGANGLGQDPNATKVFVQNAEIAYRPTSNVQLHLAYRQSPYGAYASPYGYGGYGAARLGTAPADLFWRDAR